MTKIVLQLNGAAPYYLVTSQDLEAEAVIVDWDDVNAGAFTSDALLDLAESVATLCPQAAIDLRATATDQTIEENYDLMIEEENDVSDEDFHRQHEKEN